MKIRQWQSGQALSEAMVTLPLLVLILVAGASLYNLMGADIDTNKAARIAAWHGVLYQNGASGMTQASINQRIERNLAATVLDRNRIDFSDVRPGKADSYLVKSIKSGDGQLGIKNIDYGSATYNYPANAASGLSDAAGLSQNNLTGVAISVPVKTSATLLKVVVGQTPFKQTLATQSTPTDNVTGQQRFALHAQAALVTNSGVPAGEQDFHDTVLQHSADGALTKFEPLSPVIGVFLNEMRTGQGDGLKTVANEQSQVLPSRLGTFKP